MGKHFALALQLPAYRSRHNRKTITASNLKTEYIGAAVLVFGVALLLSYFIQVNNFATAGYKITQTQNKISDLSDQYKKLETSAAELQSISSIQSAQAVTSMVPVSDMNYVQTTALTER